MSEKIGELYYEITAQDKAFKDALSKSKKDLSDFNKKLKKTNTEMKQSTLSAKGFGKSLLGVGFAFGGIAFGIKKFTDAASDAEEALQKFDVVFKDVLESADLAVERMRNDFGMAREEAIKLLGNTGDLLTGFGMSGDAALNMSEKSK